MKVRECMEKEIAPIMAKVFSLVKPDFSWCHDNFFGSGDRIYGTSVGTIFHVNVIIFPQDASSVRFQKFHWYTITGNTIFMVFQPDNFCVYYSKFVFQYWEKAEFPFHVVPKLGALGIAGGTIKVIVWILLGFMFISLLYLIFYSDLSFQGYGCPGLSITANAISTAEVARVDASCSTFILVHSSLGMLTICMFIIVFLYFCGIIATVQFGV